MQNYHVARTEMVERLTDAVKHLPLNMIIRQLVGDLSNEQLKNMVEWQEACSGEKEKGKM